ncbi:hypothetical protein HUJ05_001497 [Dendroctonus ponderosae]|nr:hypothetical protein HUJ05_001497 [Dendroctonus ponderosae]
MLCQQEFGYLNQDSLELALTDYLKMMELLKYTPSGRRSFMGKPLSANIKSPHSMCCKTPQFFYRRPTLDMLYSHMSLLHWVQYRLIPSMYFCAYMSYKNNSRLPEKHLRTHLSIAKLTPEAIGVLMLLLDLAVVVQYQDQAFDPVV